MTVSGTNGRRPGAAVRRGLAALAAAALLMPLASGVATAEVGTSAVQASATQALTPPAPVALPEGDQGFTLMKTGDYLVVENLAAYEVQLVQNEGGPDVEALRADVEYAISQVNATGHLDLRLREGTTGAPEQSFEYGVIRIEANTEPGCTVAEPPKITLGCAGPTAYVRSDQYAQAMSGRVRIEPAYFDREENIRRVNMTHELMHALGLSHYEGEYQGRQQIMASSMIEDPTLGAGDIAGLAFLASNRTSVVRGALDSVTPEGDGQVRVSGWALDGKTEYWIDVTVLVDGVEVQTVLASDTYPGLNDAFGLGDWHGFSLVVPVPDGAQELCVIGRDARGAIGDTVIGCQGLVPEPEIVGGLDAVEVVGASTVRVTGWARDTASDEPVDLSLFVDGQIWHEGSADQRYTGADPAYSGGDRHGFRFIADVWEDTSELCVVAHPGGDRAQQVELGCQDLASLASPPDDGRPVGYIGSIYGPSMLSAGGFSPASTKVTLTINGVRGALGTVYVSSDREVLPGVEFPAGELFDATVRFDTDVEITDVCLQLEAADGAMVTVDCVQTLIEAGPDRWVPKVGAIETATYADGVLEVTGWAGAFGDPVEGQKVQLHVSAAYPGQGYYDFEPASTGAARPDIVAEYGLGSAHGFTIRIEVDLEPGTYSVQGAVVSEDGGAVWQEVMFEVP